MGASAVDALFPIDCRSTGTVRVTRQGSTYRFDVEPGSLPNGVLGPAPAKTLKGNAGTATGPADDLTADQARSVLKVDQVDNTRDIDKPVSTKTAKAISDSAAAVVATVQTAAVNAATAAAATAATQATAAALALPPVVDYSALTAGTERAYRDLLYHFWDPYNPSLPRIRPTRSVQPGIGEVNDQALKISFWQMTMYFNVLYWEWKRTRSEAVRLRLVQQWAFIRSQYTDAQMRDATSNSGLVNTSDDLCWAIHFFLQVHEATGDQRALDIVVGDTSTGTFRPGLFDNGRTRFADPTNSGTGMLYSTPVNGDPDHQDVTTLFDSMIAIGMLYAYKQNASEGLLSYAITTFGWTQQYLKNLKAGTQPFYFIHLDIKAGSPTRLKALGYDRPQDIHRGGSISYLTGNMAVAAGFALLYRITGTPAYLAEAQSIVRALVDPSTFGRTYQGKKLFVNDRDGWSNGYWAPLFVEQVLTLPTSDATTKAAFDLARLMINNTALSIIAQRTGEGYYGADWSGPERNSSSVYAGDYDTWFDQGTATAQNNPSSSGSGIALPQQLMTSATSVSMIQAAAILDAQTRRR